MRKNKVDPNVIAMPIGATNTITHIYPTDKLQNLPPSRWSEPLGKIILVRVARRDLDESNTETMTTPTHHSLSYGAGAISIQ